MFMTGVLSGEWTCHSMASSFACVMVLCTLETLEVNAVGTSTKKAMNIHLGRACLRNMVLKTISNFATCFSHSNILSQNTYKETRDLVAAMAKTSWFIGGVKHKTKKKKTSTKASATLTIDGKLTLSLPGTAFAGTDPERERDPPPEPTPISFPAHVESEGRPWTEHDAPPSFQSLFSRILKPSDISEEHLKALNIKTLPKCSISELVPDALDGSSYLSPAMPPPQIEDDKPTGPPNEITRKRKDFDDRLAELRIDNDLAFRVLSKRVPVGTKPPRVAFMRKFYEGLENMSQYWDCSLDQYYDIFETHRGDDGGNCVKRQRLENGGFSPRRSPDQQSRPDFEKTVPILTSHSASSNSEAELNATDALRKEDQEIMDEASRHIRSTSATPEPQLQKRYKGRRNGTGRDMPDQFRTDTVRAFVEGAVWAFRTSLSIPRLPPIVQFNKLNLPVRQTGAVYRLPSDRTKARQGWQEGPILSLQVRADSEFQDENGKQREQMCRLDSLREIAGLLQLAQERRREGRKEVKPGEGMWWTTKPRWGGGEGGDAQNEIGNTDILQAAEELLGAAREKSGKPGKDRSRAPAKKTPAMLWKELKPGRGNWDPRTEYVAIGKEPSSEWDEVSTLDVEVYDI